MLCAISGEAPQVPVASKKNGQIYEKRLIEAYIDENGKDPVTGEELSRDDLVDIKSAHIVRPRPPTLTSIPSLLSTFQTEWDALALETFTLRQQLAQTRQELSTALYQHDAAVRVIARLTRERDEARSALSQVSLGGTQIASNGEEMQVDGQPLPEALATKIDSTQEKLSSTRRKRPIPEDWTTSELIQSYGIIQNSDELYPGARSFAIDASGDLVLIGGRDGVAGIYSISQSKLTAVLEAGSGPITDALWAGSRAILSTAAGVIKVFENGNELGTFNSHAGEATSVALHPSGDILASVGVDKSYVVYDLTTMKMVTQIFTDSELLSVKFHPDGHLIAAGGLDGQIKIFSVKDGVNAANFGCTGPVGALSFSENGRWLAASSKGETSVTIWDLGKGSLLKTLEIGGPVAALEWDYTGQFLALAGPSGVSVQQYTKASKAWSEPLKSAVPALAIRWGSLGQSLVTADSKGVLTVLGPQ